MLLNDAKGSLGMFSRAGRYSAEKYHILMRKDEIINGQNRKINLPDIFTPDENFHKPSDNMEEDIDIFATRTKEKETTDLNTKMVRKQNKKKQKPKDEITKYLEMKKKNRKKIYNPACTKYNPKNEYIYKRILTGPVWDASIKKNFSIMPKEEVDPKFYISHTEFKVDGKNFIDLARQTHRASFSSSTNIRIRNVKSSLPSRRADTTLPLEAKTGLSFYSNNDKDQSYYNSNDEDAGKPEKVPQNEIKKNFSQTATSTNRWVKVQAPDFKKVISREQLEKIYGDKRTVIPFSVPSFKWTHSSKI